MSDYDLLIIADHLSAHLLAGYLATTHGRRVALICDPAQPFRIRQTHFGSFAFKVRPETWSLVARCRDDCIRYFRGIAGRGAVTRVTPEIACWTTESADALAHMAPLVTPLGMEIEIAQSVESRHANPNVVAASAQVRGGHRLDGALIWTKVDDWRRKAGVATFERLTTPVTLATSGSARWSVDGEHHAAEQILLFDARGMNEHLAHHPDLSEMMRSGVSTGLSVPQRGGARTLFVPDIGGVFHHDKGGSWQMVVEADYDQAPALFSGSVPELAGTRLIGASTFVRMRMPDGGGVAARIGRAGPVILSGFDEQTPFLIPAIARWLVGVTTPEEHDYFEARTVGKARSPFVGEFKPTGFAGSGVGKQSA